jgi:hypothetical protein
MKILSIRPAPPGGKTIARFDVELMPGVKLYDLKLIRGERGYRVFGPSIGGGAAATFAPAIADKLVQLALGDVSRHDASRAA